MFHFRVYINTLVNVMNDSYLNRVKGIRVLTTTA